MPPLSMETISEKRGVSIAGTRIAWGGQNGYPFDTMGISSTHRGHSKVFKKAGFRQDGKRWTCQGWAWRGSVSGKGRAWNDERATVKSGGRISTRNGR
jgi:hypothetical protein